MATTLIGTLRPHAKGVHVQANAYNIMDVVTSADGSRAYMAVKDVPAGTALTNTAYWCIYTDMSEVKAAMENAAARADASAASANEAILNLTDYTSEYALRVRGEIAESAGNPVTIAPDEGSLVRPVTVFEPKQVGSGDPSLNNNRPFIGYDALELIHSGKNLVNMATVTSEGSNAWTNTYRDILLPPGTYTMRTWMYQEGTATKAALSVRKLSDIMTEIAQTGSTAASQDLVVTFTVADNEKGVRVYFYSNNTGTALASKCSFTNIIIETGNKYTGYEAYKGKTTYTAQPGQTVYGGTMNWNTGKLASRFYKIVFDGVTMGAKVSGTDYAGASYTYILPPEMPYALKNGGKAYGNKVKASTDTVMAFGLPNDLTGVTSTDPITTVVAKYNAVLKAWYDAGDPLVIVYEMAEPLVIQLAPHQILALKGSNTLYGDGDTIETLWVKPLETSIAERVAPLIRRIEALGG